MCIWKQWKTPQNRAKNLMKLGVDKDTAKLTAYYGKGLQSMSESQMLQL